MSILASLLETEKKREPSPSATAGDEKTSRVEILQPEKNFASVILPAVTRPEAPCSQCGSPMFWESIYRDSTFRCLGCEPAPARRFVGKLFAIVFSDDGMITLEEVTATDADTPELTEKQQAEQERRERIEAANEAARYFWAPDRWQDAKPLSTTAGQCPRCGCTEFSDTPIRPGWVRRDCAKCNYTLDVAEEKSPAAVQPYHRPTPFAGGSAKAKDDQQSSTANPGCDRDYRGKGGECIHAGDLSKKETANGVRCVCKDCGKFVGYLRAKRGSEEG